MKKISVIIPIYNASKYLTDCIDSFLANSFDNFELIIVDDHSTDDSINICKSYNNNKIKVFLNEGKNGVSSARNIGIYKSTGDIITFCDADDFVSNDYFSNIESYFVENSFIVFNYSRLYVNTKRDVKVTLKNKSIEEGLVNRSNLGGYVWNKIYSAYIIKKNNLFFNDELSYLEDLDFNIRYSQFCNNCTILDLNLYFYRMNLSSVVNRFNQKSLSVFDSIKCIDNYRFLSTECHKELYILNFEFYYRFRYFSKKQKKYKGFFINNYHIKFYFINKKIFIKMFLLKFFPKIYFILLKKKGNKNVYFQ